MFRISVLTVFAWAVFACHGAIVARGSEAPSAPRDVQVVNQGGPSHLLTNYQAIAWQAGTVGPNPVDHYKIYRNGAVYATSTTTKYVDANAPGSNDPTFAKPAKIYAYNPNQSTFPLYGRRLDKKCQQPEMP